MPTNDYSKNIVYLSKEQYQELITNNTLTTNGQTITYNNNDIYVTPQAEPITDIKLAGTSIGNNGVANIPYADSTNSGGIVRANSNFGITYAGSGLLSINCADSSLIKTGSNAFFPIVPYFQHYSIFYGLSKVAGVDLANETVTLGTYPDASKAAIQKMLGISSLLAPIEDDGTADAAYTVGSLFTSNGKLYKATTAIAIGDMIVPSTNCNEINLFTYINEKANKVDTILDTTLSIGRKAGTIIGEHSVAIGNKVEASGDYSFSNGNSTIASGPNSKAEGYGAVASGSNSHAEGNGTIANGSNVHAEGKYNVEQTIFPNWSANTHYNVGDKVFKLPTTYECIEENTDASWTAAHWKIYGFTSEVALVIGNGSSDEVNDRSNAYMVDWSGNGHYMGNIYVGCNSDSTGGTRVLHDVKIGNTSIVSNGVATIPVRSNIVSGSSDLVTSNAVNSALTVMFGTTSAQIKEGTHTFRGIVPAKQHESVFYGLAKAAGDTTQASSANELGTYTESAKTAIRGMLGIDGSAALVEEVTGTTPTITALPNVRYNCSEVSTISITPPANGTCDVFFTSGSIATILTVPNTVKWPAWFDATALETDMIYEIMITDGVYGSVMTWES